MGRWLGLQSLGTWGLRGRVPTRADPYKAVVGAPFQPIFAVGECRHKLLDLPVFTESWEILISI